MPRFGKLQILIVTIAVIFLSLLYFFYPAAGGSFHPNCPFNYFTGLYCPGCGAQRAASALLHGKFLKAADFNILFVISIPFVSWSGIVFTWNNFKSKKLSQRFFYSPVFVRVCLIVILLFAILRNIPFTPFKWLAP